MPITNDRYNGARSNLNIDGTFATTEVKLPIATSFVPGDSAKRST
jgi:hypothetical protein